MAADDAPRTLTVTVTKPNGVTREAPRRGRPLVLYKKLGGLQKWEATETMPGLRETGFRAEDRKNITWRQGLEEARERAQFIFCKETPNRTGGSDTMKMWVYYQTSTGLPEHKKKKDTAWISSNDTPDGPMSVARDTYMIRIPEEFDFKEFYPLTDDVMGGGYKVSPQFAAVNFNKGKGLNLPRLYMGHEKGEKHKTLQNAIVIGIKPWAWESEITFLHNIPPEWIIACNEFATSEYHLLHHPYSS